tara:strand:+ start:250 stop:450 length:201 start_codon:yes stop_codon:yes gene_type:complete
MENLDSNRSIQYEQICQIIGNLYIELHSTKQESEGRYANIITNLTNQVSELVKENEDLVSKIKNKK